MRGAQIGSILLIFAGSLAAFVVGTPHTQAASLYFSPSSGQHAVGGTFTINIFVESSDQAMNAASGIIAFPSDQLRVMSVSKAGSIFNFWVQEPFFSNAAGTINFEGVILNPGFRGAGGKILSATMRIKAAGNAPLSFASGSVLANDGLGTNILKNLGTAQFGAGALLPVAAPTFFSFSIEEIPREDLTDPRARFRFKVEGETLGIDHYEIQIDAGEKEIWKDDGTGIYQVPLLSPGDHTLIVRAVDGAGNLLVGSDEFSILPLWPPVITKYPKELGENEILIVEGDAAYANADVVNADVTLWLQRGNDEPKTFTVKSGNDGLFTLAIQEENFRGGVYTLWAQVTDERGAQSDLSEKVTIIVRSPSYVIIGSFAISVLSIVIPLIALAFLLIFALWHGWIGFILYRIRVRKEFSDVERTLRKAFELLRKDIQHHTKLLNQTESLAVFKQQEKKLSEGFGHILRDAEKIIEKELNDVRREIESIKSSKNSKDGEQSAES